MRLTVLVSPLVEEGRRNRRSPPPRPYTSSRRDPASPVSTPERSGPTWQTGSSPSTETGAKRAMEVSSVSAMSRAALVSKSSTSLIDRCVCSSSSAGTGAWGVCFSNGNAARFGRRTLSLPFQRRIARQRSRSNRSEAGFVRLELVPKRRRWGAVASVSADATAVAESDEAEKSDEKELLGKLLSLVEGCDRGARLGPDGHAKVGEVVNQLEQYGIPEPLQSPLIFGNWDVAYSSNPTSPGGGYRSWIGRLIFRTREMIQVVNAPDVIINAVRFALFGIILGEVQLRGKLEPLDQKLIKINFEAPFFQLGPFKFQYGRPSSVEIAIIFLNDRVRLGRGSRGTVFVFTRR